MIKLDYTIKRNENDENREYIPNDALKEIPNLALISGPNSSGKSSFLNFLAYALGASESMLVSDSLKRKLNTVLTDEYERHQETEMKLDISTESDKYSFVKEYINNNINVKFNDKPLSRDRLSNRIDIIYDIPEAPTERLKGLTTAIESNQERYKKRIESIKIKLDAIQKELHESRNEDEINRLSEKIKIDEAKLNENKNLILERDEEIRVLKEYAIHKELKKIVSDINKEKAEVEKLEKDCRSNKNKKARTTGKERERINRYIDSIEGKIDTSRPILGNYYVETDGKFDYFIHHGIDDCKKTFEFDLKFESITKEFKKRLEEESQSLSDKSEEIETEHLVDDIIKALNGSKANLNIPGLDKTVGEILETLNLVKRKFSRSVHKKETIDSGIELLNDILDDIVKLNEEFLPKYKKEIEDAEEDQTESINSERLEKKQISLAKKIEAHSELVRTANKSGISTEWTDEEEKQIKEAIEIREDHQILRVKNYDYLKPKIKEEELELENLKATVGRKEELHKRNIFRLQEAEKKEKHKYAGKEEEVANGIKLCNSILRKMAKYSRFISYIEEKKAVEEDGFNEYNYNVSRYLGKLMGSIKHVNKVYETTSIDVLNERIVTKEGKNILFSEMGTGQGQSAYLLSQLSNLESNDKKLVVLFDEIETMDRASLLPVINKLKELKQKNKLIAGILVQKGDTDVIVRNLEEEL